LHNNTVPDAVLAGASGWPKARGVVCFSAKGVPHGEGHNRVCVCRCQWCVAERAEPEQGELFAVTQAALDNPPVR